MKSLAAKLSFILRASAIAIMCSIAVGLLFYQERVFHIHDHTFIFVADATIGALFYFSLRLLRLKDALGLLFFVYLVYIGPLTRAFQFGFTLNFTVFFLIPPVSVYVYRSMIVSAHRWENIFPPLILGGLWGSATILARLCVDVPRASFWQRPLLTYPLLILPEVLMGIAVGIGVGLGFFIVDREPVARLLKSHA